MGDTDADGFWPDASYFVPYVEQIMTARGWTTGAGYQARWRNGAANALTGDAKDGQGDRGPLDIQPIDLAWVLGFDRAQQIFNELITPAVLTNDAAQARLIPQLNALFADGSTRVQFGDYPDLGTAREALYINSRAVDAEMAYYAGFDDLNAAIGAFNLFALPKGSAFINDDFRVTVQISEVGVYLRDSFDFAGPQALGRWKLPDQVELPDVFLAGNPDGAPGLARPDDWVTMTNLAFRMWRDRTGCGQDFLIYSDIRIVPVTCGFEYAASPLPQP